MTSRSSILAGSAQSLSIPGRGGGGFHYDIILGKPHFHFLQQKVSTRVPKYLQLVLAKRSCINQFQWNRGNFKDK